MSVKIEREDMIAWLMRDHGDDLSPLGRDYTDAEIADMLRRPAQGDYYEGLEEGIAIGRRPVQGEPTDAQIERAARSIAEWSTSDVPLELCRSVARHALRAAFTAGQEDKP